MKKKLILVLILGFATHLSFGYGEPGSYSNPYSLSSGVTYFTTPLNFQGDNYMSNMTFVKFNGKGVLTFTWKWLYGEEIALDVGYDDVVLFRGWSSYSPATLTVSVCVNADGEHVAHWLGKGFDGDTGTDGCGSVSNVKWESGRTISDLFEYEIHDGHATLTGLNAPLFGGLDIPSSVSGYTINAIADKAFRDKELVFDDSYLIYAQQGISSVSISSSVMRIGSRAFPSELKSISVNSENPEFYVNNGMLISRGARSVLTSIKRTDEQNIIIPSSVIEICDGAFEWNLYGGCTVSIPEGVTNIGAKAFSGGDIHTAYARTL